MEEFMEKYTGRQLASDLWYLTKCALIGSLIGFVLGKCSANASTNTVSIVKATDSVVRIGIIDTGLDITRTSEIYNSTMRLCSDWAQDQTGMGIQDMHHSRHGTNVALTIANEVGQTPYCLVIIKVFASRSATSNPLGPYISGLRAATRLRLDYLNMSVNSGAYSKDEANYISELLRQGTTIIASAGNDKLYMPPTCTLMPACLSPSIIVVGAQGLATSNWGPRINAIEPSTSCATVPCLHGTSQAAAYHTGRLVRKRTGVQTLTTGGK
jgi:hypothetical protein